MIGPYSIAPHRRARDRRALVAAAARDITDHLRMHAEFYAVSQIAARRAHAQPTRGPSHSPGHEP
eukprot:5494633-Prymnesium_polylepis.2